MALVDVTVYYLEMLAPAHRTVPAPRDGLTVVHAESPTVPYYRSLYDAVGRQYHWLSRRKMTDEELAAILGDPRDEMHVLHVEGTPAGFAELDRRQPDEIELVFLRELVVAHAELTGSAKAAALLDGWDQAVGSFWRVAPRAEVAAIEQAHEGTA